MRPSDYPNIIFDLGGVILNIDYQRTIDAFKKLGVKDFDASFSKLAQTNIFDAYERGEISSEQFRNGLRQVFDVEVQDEEIDQAWNAMLLDLPTIRLKLLEQLQQEKRLALLSNTNDIHIQAFSRYLKDSLGLNDLSGFFSKLYYSYKVGMRKPEPRIFEHVLRDQGFNPSETLFIDDSPQHIEGARKVGLNVYHLKVEDGETILDLF